MIPGLASGQLLAGERSRTSFRFNNKEHTCDRSYNLLYLTPIYDHLLRVTEVLCLGHEMAPVPTVLVQHSFLVGINGLNWLNMEGWQNCLEKCLSPFIRMPSKWECYFCFTKMLRFALSVSAVPTAIDSSVHLFTYCLGPWVAGAIPSSQWETCRETLLITVHTFTEQLKIIFPLSFRHILHHIYNMLCLWIYRYVTTIFFLPYYFHSCLCMLPCQARHARYPFASVCAFLKQSGNKLFVWKCTLIKFRPKNIWDFIISGQHACHMQNICDSCACAQLWPPS